MGPGGNRGSGRGFACVADRLSRSPWPCLRLLKASLHEGSPSSTFAFGWVTGFASGEFCDVDETPAADAEVEVLVLRL